MLPHLKERLPGRVRVGDRPVVHEGDVPDAPAEEAPGHVAAKGAGAEQEAARAGKGVLQFPFFFNRKQFVDGYNYKGSAQGKNNRFHHMSGTPSKFQQQDNFPQPQSFIRLFPHQVQSRRQPPLHEPEVHVAGRLRKRPRVHLRPHVGQAGAGLALGVLLPA